MGRDEQRLESLGGTELHECLLELVLADVHHPPVSSTATYDIAITDEQDRRIARHASPA
ncbi:hypothetical protein [Streptomyces pseudoechinosporeus]